MPYNELYSGFTPPANITRKNGIRYLWKKNGVIYVQKAIPEGNKWEAEVPADYETGVEVDTGENWVDGKPIYKKTLIGSSFSVSGSYSIIPHGVANIDALISAEGYVGDPGSAQYATYANYIDGLGNFRFFWTGGGGFAYTFTIRYTKS